MQDYFQRFAAICAAPCAVLCCYFAAFHLDLHLHFILASFHQHLQLRLLHFAAALAFFSFAALGAAFTPQLQQLSASDPIRGEALPAPVSPFTRLELETLLKGNRAPSTRPNRSLVSNFSICLLFWKALEDLKEA
ncbi:hypothetical protein SLEP1_g58257 [Rubroshorea leprosula]|uniref:Transmembrane protein n=1 Tax=Rubroshorea leprosula TaxID=152421 RepID=A0AAV5MSS9_9ROSI|nr:hypothetical protein SLEP1_g58257 [Rubroshorea leprosula]